MRASGYERAANDWYCEPRWMVNALLDAEPMVGTCWDPSCGGGNIPEALRARGIPCEGSDLIDRGYGTPGQDFLVATQRIDNIVSNPPYGIIQPFVERALELAASKVCILGRLAFLEGQGRLSTLFRPHPISRVWVSSRRASMPPGGSEVKAAGGTIAFAWFVWDKAYTGPTVLDHLPC